MTDSFEYAERYLKLGWSTVPTPRTQKYPKGTQWAEFQRKVPSHAQLMAWDADQKICNLCVITGKISGIVVVDVDPRKGGSIDGLPDTGCISKTGGGGYHYIYRYPRDANKITTCTDIRPGIDIRADGGLIIVPPSFHICDPHKCEKPCSLKKDRYTWLKFEPSKLALPPKWVYEKQEQTKQEHTKQWVSQLILEGTKRGSRNDDATRLAGYLASIKNGMPEDIAHAFLTVWDSVQKEPLASEGSDIDTIVNSIYKTEQTARTFSAMPLSAFMLKHGSEEVKWSIVDWLPESTIAFLVSPPAGYKTWFAFDLAASFASGQPFLGSYPVQNPGPVLVVQQEDFTGDIASRNGLIIMSRSRVSPPVSDGETFEVSVMPSDSKVPIYFHTERKLKFGDEKVMAGLREFIIAHGIRLVLIDPLYSAARLDDYLVEASQQMFALKDIRDETGCSFLIVHHTKKAGEGWDTQNMWGSQFINAFKETIFFVKRAHSKTKIVMYRSFKSAPVMPFTELVFDIDTKQNRYAVATRDISAEEAAAFGSDNIQQDILTVLVRPMTINELAQAIQRTEPELRKALRAMIKRGALTCGADSKYRITPIVEEDGDD